MSNVSDQLKAINAGAQKDLASVKQPNMGISSSVLKDASSMYQKTTGSSMPAINSMPTYASRISSVQQDQTMVDKPLQTTTQGNAGTLENPIQPQTQAQNTGNKVALNNYIQSQITKGVSWADIAANIKGTGIDVSHGSLADQLLNANFGAQAAANNLKAQNDSIGSRVEGVIANVDSFLSRWGGGTLKSLEGEPIGQAYGLQPQQQPSDNPTNISPQQAEQNMTAQDNLGVQVLADIGQNIASLPIRVAETLEQAGGKASGTFTPQGNVEKFFYGNQQQNSYIDTVNSVIAATKKMGLDKGSSALVGGAAGSLQVAADFLGIGIPEEEVAEQVLKTSTEEGAEKIIAKYGQKSTPELVDSIVNASTKKEAVRVVAELSGKVEPINNIDSAAVKVGDKVYTGISHADAISKAPAELQPGLMAAKDEIGRFQLKDGSLISRDEAEQRFGIRNSEEVPHLKVQQDAQIPKESPLIAEARKYKTEEEFINGTKKSFTHDVPLDTKLTPKNLYLDDYNAKYFKGQEDRLATFFRGGKNLRPDAQGNIWLTGDENAAFKYSEDFNKPSMDKVSSAIVDSKKPFLLKTSSGSGLSSEVENNFKKLGINPDNWDANSPEMKSKAINYAKQHGYDSVYFPDSQIDGRSPMDSLVVFDKNKVIYTKYGKAVEKNGNSLSEIYKQSQSPSPIQGEEKVIPNTPEANPKSSDLPPAQPEDVSQSQQTEAPQRGAIQGMREAPNLSAQTKSLLDGNYVLKHDDELMGEAKALLMKGGDKVDLSGVKNLDDKLIATSKHAIYLDSIGDHEGAANLLNNIAETKTEVARALRSGRFFDSLSPEAWAESAAKKIQNYNELVNPSKRIPELTGAQQGIISDMAKDILNLPEGRDRDLAIQNLQKYIGKLTPSSVASKIFALYRTGLLTATRLVDKMGLSHVITNSLEATSNLTGSAVDRVASLFTGERKLISTLSGNFKGGYQGVLDGVDNLVNGFDRPGSGGFGNDFSKQVNFGDSWYGKIAQKYVDTVQRVHGSLYKPFYGAAHLNSLFSQGMAEASNQELTGKAAEDFIADFVANPPQEAATRADQEAAYTTYQNHTALGDWLSKGQKSLGPVGKVLFPFTQVPAAITERVFAYTPVGFTWEVGSQIASGQFDQRAFSKAIGRSITGTGLLYLGGLAYSKGIMTLSYPTSRSEQALWRTEGKQENSILIDGKWRELSSTGAMGDGLAMGANVAAGWLQNGVEGAASQGTAGMLNVAANTPYFESADDALSAVKDPSGYAMGALKSYGGSVIPTGISNIASATDPDQRITSSLSDAIKSKLPWAREGLLPQRGITGQPLPRAEDVWGSLFDPLYSSADNSTPIVNELNRLELAGLSATPSPVEKTVSVTDQFGNSEKVNLTPSQQNNITQIEGGIFNNLTGSVIGSDYYNNLPDTEKQSLIKDITTSARTSAIQNVVNGTPLKDTDNDVMSSSISPTVKAAMVYETLKKATGGNITNEQWHDADEQISAFIKQMDITPEKQLSEYTSVVTDTKNLVKDDQATAFGLDTQKKGWTNLTTDERAQMLVQHFKDMPIAQAQQQYSQMTDAGVITPDIAAKFQEAWSGKPTVTPQEMATMGNDLPGQDTTDPVVQAKYQKYQSILNSKARNAYLEENPDLQDYLNQKYTAEDQSNEAEGGQSYQQKEAIDYARQILNNPSTMMATLRSAMMTVPANQRSAFIQQIIASVRNRAQEPQTDPLVDPMQGTGQSQALNQPAQSPLGQLGGALEGLAGSPAQAATNDFSQYDGMELKPDQNEWRTDRNNNLIASAVKYGEENEYTQALDNAGIKWTYGDRFGGDPSMATIKVEGNPVAAADAILANSDALQGWYLNHTGAQIMNQMGVFNNQQYQQLDTQDRLKIIEGIYGAEVGSGQLTYANS